VLKGSNNRVLASSVATVVEGKVTAYKDDGNKKNAVTVDGTAYTLVGAIMNDWNATDFSFNDTTYKVYTNADGFVIGIDGDSTVSLDDVYYVTGVAKSTSLYAPSYYAQAVSLKDGSVKEFKLTDKAIKYFGSNSDLDAAKSAIDGAIVKATGIDPSMKGLYSFDADGSKYDVKAYTGSSDYTLISNALLGDDLQKSDSYAKFGGTKVYLTSDTKIVKVEKNGSDIDVTTAVGSTNVENCEPP
jgi:hypothetical protein